MIIIMSRSAQDEQVERIQQRLRELGFGVHLSQGGGGKRQSLVRLEIKLRSSSIRSPLWRGRTGSSGA